MSLQMIGVSCRWPGCFASLSSTCFCRRIGAILPIGAKLPDKTGCCSEAVHVSKGGFAHVLDIKNTTWNGNHQSGRMVVISQIGRTFVILRFACY